MGRVKNNCKCPFTFCDNNHESTIVELIEDPKCEYVLGVYPSITTNKILHSISKKKIGIVLSAEGYSKEIIRNCHPKSSYEGIDLQDVKGLFEEERIGIWLEKIPGLWGNAFRWIRSKDIECNPRSEQNKYPRHPILHAKFVLVGNKNEGVYKGITGSYNPTVNGNDNLDNIVQITDPSQIWGLLVLWLECWINSAVLDISHPKSEKLSEFFKKQEREETRSWGDERTEMITKAWDTAELTYSKYKDEPRLHLNSFTPLLDGKPEIDFNEEYLLASLVCTRPTTYIRIWKNRMVIKSKSKAHDISTGVEDDDRLINVKTTNFCIDEVIRIPHEFYPESPVLLWRTSSKHSLHINKLLYGNFFSWLEGVKSIWTPFTREILVDYWSFRKKS